MATRQVIAGKEAGGARRYRIRSTGTFAIFEAENGRQLTPRGRKARAILAYLSSRSSWRASREELIELLWGDRGEAQARASLRQSLTEIRHACGDLVEADREHVWIDNARLAVETEDADTSEAFANLNSISPEFDAWLRSERDRKAAKAWEGLRHETEALLARDRGAEATSLVKQMRQIDPYNEDWVRLAMQAQFQAGHPAAIDRYFNEIETLLREDLGVAPASETRALRDRLLTELTRAPAKVCESAADDDEQGPATRVQRPWLTLASVAAVAAVAGAVWVSQPPTGQPPRIAVLPFEAAGVEPALAEGMSDELLSQLSRNEGLRVIGRTSSEQFKGKAADLRSIGRTLDVKYLVEGNVRGAGNQVQVAVTLVRAKDGTALWARTFHGSSGSLEAIQQAIGSAVGSSLTTAKTIDPPRLANGDAYALYVRAKALIRERNYDDLSKSIELLREAVRIDPNFAGAWAQLGGAAYLSKEDIVLDPGPSHPIRVGSREAVEHALKLDPNLAEAHAMMALLEGFRTASARAHLKRALELKPNDTQTQYWWAIAILNTGHGRAASKTFRAVADIDPLWKRPVEAAIDASFAVGDRAAAMRYLQRLKSGNPEGAADVEIFAAFWTGDFSRAVQLSLSDTTTGSMTDDRQTGLRTLIGLGFTREALLIGQFDPFLRATLQGHVPPQPEIIDFLRGRAARRTDDEVYAGIISQLARARRWSDIAALYDARLGLMDDLVGGDPGGRRNRIAYGPIMALSLKKAGRDRDAVRLALAADEAGRIFLANGEVRIPMLVQIASIEAILGRSDQALAHLEQAFGKGWRMDEFTPNPRIGENPVFATLRDDPRFQRLQRIQDAHIAKERNEVLSLDIL